MQKYESKNLPQIESNTSFTHGSFFVSDFEHGDDRGLKVDGRGRVLFVLDGGPNSRIIHNSLIFATFMGRCSFFMRGETIIIFIGG